MDAVKTVEELAHAMIRDGRYHNASDPAGVLGGYDAGEYYYTVFDLVGMAADSGTALTPEHREAIERLMIDDPEADPADLADLKEALARIPRASSAA